VVEWVNERLGSRDGLVNANEVAWGRGRGKSASGWELFEQRSRDSPPLPLPFTREGRRQAVDCRCSSCRRECSVREEEYVSRTEFEEWWEKCSALRERRFIDPSTTLRTAKKNADLSSLVVVC